MRGRLWAAGESPRRPRDQARGEPRVADQPGAALLAGPGRAPGTLQSRPRHRSHRSEEHTSELQSQSNLVCRLLLEKKKNKLYRSSLRIEKNTKRRARLASKFQHEHQVRPSTHLAD